MKTVSFITTLLVLVNSASFSQVNYAKIGSERYPLNNLYLNTYSIQTDSVFRIKIPSYTQESNGVSNYNLAGETFYYQVLTDTIDSLNVNQVSSVYDRSSLVHCTITLNDSVYCLDELNILAIDSNQTLKFKLQADSCSKYHHIFFPLYDKANITYYLSWGRYYNIISQRVAFIYFNLLIRSYD